MGNGKTEKDIRPIINDKQINLHLGLSNFIEKELGKSSTTNSDKDVNDFSKKYSDLKKLRVKADYKNESISWNDSQNNKLIATFEDLKDKHFIYKTYMKNHAKLLLMLPLSLWAMLANAEKNLKDSPFSASLELSTKYMWRGIEYGTAPTVFPMIGYSTHGFNAFAMGAYAIDGSHQEVDLGVSYTASEFTVGVSDYYYPSSVGEKDGYFMLSNRETGHWVEAYATWTGNKIPLWVTASTYVFGADKDAEGKQMYSSYAEVGYTHSFNDDNKIALCVGANLNKGFYTNNESRFNVVNINAKYSTTFKFGSYKLPVSASYVLNPYMNKSYFTMSLYFGL